MDQLSKVPLVKGSKAHEKICRAVDLIGGLKDVAKNAPQVLQVNFITTKTRASLLRTGWRRLLASLDGLDFMSELWFHKV